MVVDGTEHAPAATGMPRPDLAADRRDPRYRSGWWATVPVHPQATRGAVELEASVEVTGHRTTVPLARIAVEPAEAPSADDGARAGDLIAVCMATHDPDLGLFATQITSLRDQTDERWLCVISDDGSPPEVFAALEAIVGGDPRFVVSRAQERRGFYRNFERALELAPARAELIALCDHDDRWYPEKLAVLRTSLGGAQLVYSDQRLVDRAGTVLRDSLWVGRRNNHTDIASMLVAGSVTGASVLMRRDVADAARPFPDTPGIGFHDHWISLVALALGDVAYVDRPLYDYVQHGRAVFGDVTAGPRLSRRGGCRSWRAAYFCGYLDREVQAQALLARLGEQMRPDKRRALARYAAAQRNPLALAWLAARSLRRFTGRDETLGSESQLALGVLWRWLVALRARLPGGLADASFPDPMSFQQTRLRRWRASL